MFAKDLKTTISAAGAAHRTRYPLTLFARLRYTAWDMTFLVHARPLFWALVTAVIGVHLAFQAHDHLPATEVWCVTRALVATGITVLALSLCRQARDIYRLAMERAKDLATQSTSSSMALVTTRPA